MKLSSVIEQLQALQTLYKNRPEEELQDPEVYVGISGYVLKKPSRIYSRNVRRMGPTEYTDDPNRGEAFKAEERAGDGVQSTGPIHDNGVIIHFL